MMPPATAPPMATMAAGPPPVNPHFSAAPDLLAQLAALDSCRIEQEMKAAEILIGFEQAKSYRVKTGSGQDLFFAGERTDSAMDAVARNLIGTDDRGFAMDLLDPSGKVPVASFRKP